MPVAGTLSQSTNRELLSPSYGSFGHTNINLVSNKENNNNPLIRDVGEDNDSGMSSEENEDSIKINLSSTINDNISKNLSSSLEDNFVTKCLTVESQCAEQWNEIPSCSSNYNNVNVNNTNTEKSVSLLGDSDVIIVEKNNISEFIVIDLTCNVDDDCDLNDTEEIAAGTNEFNVNYHDYSDIDSVNSCRSIVPVTNNELVHTESQKLLSLSLSILLAALLQAMRCFAQFLEDIVVPHR